MTTTFTFKTTDTTSYAMQGTLLHDETSAVQHIQVFHNQEHGNVLVLDGNVMLSQRDEAMYHELLVMPAALSRPRARKALIIGGGDGFAARYLLQQGFDHIDVVDIDPQVAKVSESFFPEVAQVFSHDKVHWHFQDAHQFVPNCKERYDYIALDLTDPDDRNDIVHPLYTEMFLTRVASLLNSKGILVAQVGCPYNNTAHFKKMRKFMHNCFTSVCTLGHYIPCYGEHQYFVLGSNGEIDLHSETSQAFMNKELKCRGGSQVYEPLAPTIWTGVNRKLHAAYQ